MRTLRIIWKRTRTTFPIGCEAKRTGFVHREHRIGADTAITVVVATYNTDTAVSTRVLSDIIRNARIENVGQSVMRGF